MALESVEIMDEQPYSCLVCGGDPKDEMGKSKPGMVKATGIDVDWGNSVFLCGECTNLIADLIGRAKQTDHEALQDEYREAMKELRKLNKRFTRLRNQAQAMASGEKAKKELRRV